MPTKDNAAKRLIKNVRVLGQEGTCIVVCNGVITYIGDTPDVGEYDVIDGDGALAIPGLIDTHVHFRQPGMEEKGTIATESRAAVAGGVTSFIDMPNTKPPTLSAETLNEKYAIAERTSVANYGFFLGAGDNTPDIIASIPRHILPGVKLFMGTTTGAVTTPSDNAVERLFKVCAERNIPIVVHAEDNAVIDAAAAAAIARYGSREAVPISEHALIRSREACRRATAKAVNLAVRYGTHLHIAHVSTKDEVDEFLSSEPIEDKLVTAETSPLYLDPEFCKAPTTWRTKVNPAIKTQSDADALQQALLDGKIDTIATDHAPHLPAQKQGGEFSAASGAPSLQFALPVMLNYLSPQVIVKAMCENPIRIFGINRPGCLRVGAPAEIVLIKKLAQPHVITDADVITPARWTPFVGRSIGCAVTTLPFTPQRLCFSGR